LNSGLLDYLFLQSAGMALEGGDPLLAGISLKLEESSTNPKENLLFATTDEEDTLFGDKTKTKKKTNDKTKKSKSIFEDDEEGLDIGKELDHPLATHGTTKKTTAQSSNSKSPAKGPSTSNKSATSTTTSASSLFAEISDDQDVLTAKFDDLFIPKEARTKDKSIFNSSTQSASVDLGISADDELNFSIGSVDDLKKFQKPVQTTAPKPAQTRIARTLEARQGPATVDEDLFSLVDNKQSNARGDEIDAFNINAYFGQLHW